MYCNQAVYGNGFNTGQYSTCDQIPQGINLAPTIVGEGEVTSIALADGACQYFFRPTVKWWTPITANTCPLQYNDNYNNPYYNTNLGVWYIRSIANSTPPFTANTHLRQEAPRYSYGSDCSMNTVNPGYQLKFHNDGTTSTTDIHYFYPCLRQYDCTFNFPANGCVAVQVDTPTVNTCHYDTVCSKPCHCTQQQNYLSESPSKMSLDTRNKSTVDFCECHSTDNTVKTGSNIKQRQLLPRDERKKRIKLERNSRRYSQSKVNICKCPDSIDKSTVMHTDSGSGGGPDRDVGTQKQSHLTREIKHQLKREWEAQKPGHSKTKDIDCECPPPPSSEKCVTTLEKLDDSECERNIGLQECCNNGSKVINAKTLITDNADKKSEIWCPITETSKQRFECTQCINNNRG